MSIEQPAKLDLSGMIQHALGRRLEAGELGVLLSRAGVGKTACLTHVALEHLFQGQEVVHVSIRETPETVKIWYQELVKNIVTAQSLSEGEAAYLQSQVETHRSILTYHLDAFSPARMEQSIRNLKEQIGFHPSLVVLDGLDFGRVTRATLEELQDVLKRLEVSAWMTARTHRHITTINERGIPYPCHDLDDLFQAILALEPLPDGIRLMALKLYDRSHPEHLTISLNTQTFMLKKD
ncbi:MAG: hypothetical protein HQK57_08315 [Deltaproteobacteria bacterium]|nr:hypothetical protein [Deltaproteobacteria bacterium]